MKLARRQFLQLSAGAAAVPAVSRIASAQNFPTRPVTLIIPWPAGTATDITLRTLASATEKHLGRPIVIENRPGASGTLAPAQMAASAKPDGYTISWISLPVFRAPFLMKTTNDPIKDFTYIIGLTGYTYGVVVRSDSPWKTFQELLADARANPGKITYGSPGAVTIQNITMAQIAKRLDIQWIHVPFKGSPESLNALLGGHINVSADTTAWGPQVNSGRLRLLVTWGAARAKSWPDVPTLKEVGINMVANAPFGLAGPARMDPGVVKTLHDTFKRGMDEPAFAAALASLDMVPVYMNSDDYHDYAMKQIAEEKRIIEELGLKEQ